MNDYEAYEIRSIPFWCRDCDEAATNLLELPEPKLGSSETIYQVCESCYNEICNEELESVRERQLRNETNEEWVKRCNQVSEKYGFGTEHHFCESCYKPQPHEPDCIECNKENYYERHKTPQQ